MAKLVECNLGSGEVVYVDLDHVEQIRTRQQGGAVLKFANGERLATTQEVGHFLGRKS